MPEAPKTHGAGRPQPRKHVDPTTIRNSNAMGYDYSWQKFREIFLRKNPLCVMCKADGRVEAATEVDHDIPHRGDKSLFWNNKFNALCKPCHSKKTARGL